MLRGELEHAMRYSVMAGGLPIVDLSFVSDLATAKRHGELLAAERPDVEVCIDGYPEGSGLRKGEEVG